MLVSLCAGWHRSVHREDVIKTKLFQLERRAMLCKEFSERVRLHTQAFDAVEKNQSICSYYIAYLKIYHDYCGLQLARNFLSKLSVRSIYLQVLFCILPLMFLKFKVCKGLHYDPTYPPHRKDGVLTLSHWCWTLRVSPSTRQCIGQAWS